MDKNFNIQKFESKQEALREIRIDDSVGNFNKIPESFFEDITFVKKILTCNSNYYSLLPFEAKKNKDICLHVINAIGGLTLDKVPFSLRNDLDVIKSLVNNHGYFNRFYYYDYMGFFCLSKNNPTIWRFFVV